jgi:hypothetical protein
MDITLTDSDRLKELNDALLAAGRPLCTLKKPGIKDTRYNFSDAYQELSGDEYYQYEDNSFYVTTARFGPHLKEIYWRPEGLLNKDFFNFKEMWYDKMCDWSAYYVSSTPDELPDWHDLYLPLDYHYLPQFLEKMELPNSMTGLILRFNKSHSVNALYYHLIENYENCKYKIYYYDFTHKRAKATLVGTEY